MQRNPTRRSIVFAWTFAAALLTACGGGDGAGDHGDEDIVIDTAGRLVVTESGANTVRIHDLDSPTFAVEATYTLDHPPSAVYASPQGRYALLFQRLQNQVQFVDGGIWQEDHGIHLHDYKQSSRLLSWRLEGPRPTHYDVQHGTQAAVFMDGNATAIPPQNAAARLLSDSSIGAGTAMASLDLSVPIHGLAEPMNNKLLTVSRADDAPDTLPTHLHLYVRSGATYTSVGELPTRCNGMHGSFSSGSHTIVGCLDGMLLVRHTGAASVDDGVKLGTTLRVGTIAGHPRLPDRFIGIATEGAAPGPVTTRFYAVDATGSAPAVAALEPQGWEVGRVSRAHGFDRSGQRFYLLDDQGTLTVMQWQTGGWVTAARVPGVIPSMPAASPWPSIIANGARDVVYLTDPQAKQLVVVAADTGAVLQRLNLGFAPSGAAWLGIVR